MATILYYPDGRAEPVSPMGKHWTLEELQTMVGGYIEIVRTTDNRWMLVNEEGHRLGLTYNEAATHLYIHGSPVRPILGCALVADTQEEIDGPDEEEG